jgi:hypothetical protein
MSAVRMALVVTGTPLALVALVAAAHWVVPPLLHAFAWVLVTLLVATGLL